MCNQGEVGAKTRPRTDRRRTDEHVVRRSGVRSGWRENREQRTERIERIEAKEEKRREEEGGEDEEADRIDGQASRRPTIRTGNRRQMDKRGCAREAEASQCRRNKRCAMKT